MGIPELRPKQECATRWNSTFYMLKRMLETKDAIISTLALINASIEPLSQEVWELVKEVCAVLQPFEEVTVEISADRYLEPSKHCFFSLLLFSHYYTLQTQHIQYNASRIICHILLKN